MKKKLLDLKTSLSKLGYNSERLNRLIAQEVHTVAPGETLNSISGNDPAYEAAIKAANPNLNPDPRKLQVGQKIKMPPKRVSPNDSLQPSDSALSLIKKYEGKPGTGEPYLIPYDDGFGNVTAGWGHNYGKGDYRRYRHLTLDKANQLLTDDLGLAASFVKRNVDAKLSQGQFDAVVSLVFNAGGSKVYRSEVFKAINSGDFARARRLFPTALIGKNQGGLIQRRKDETALFSQMD